MNIAIIGTGIVGRVLGKRWEECGHEIIFGSRTPDSPAVHRRMANRGLTAEVTTYAQAAKDAEVVLLAVKHLGIEDSIDRLGSLAGKIVIDPTVPLNAENDALTIGFSTSAGEQIAARLPGASVVKAFNHVGARAIMVDPVFDGEQLTMFICGDDAEAKRTVAGLVREQGFEPVDCGDITTARYLEQLAMLWITLSEQLGNGGQHGFKLLTR